MPECSHEPSQDAHQTARLLKSSANPDLGELVARLRAAAPNASNRQLLYEVADALAASNLRAEALKVELAKAREWSPNDREDQWTLAIRAAHPVNSDDPQDQDHFDTAMDMVGARRSKFALVELVSWLVGRADKAEAEVAGLKAVLVSVRDWDSLYDAFPHALAMQVREALTQKDRP